MFHNTPKKFAEDGNAFTIFSSQAAQARSGWAKAEATLSLANF